jgi:Ribose/xylose/arabinose/galactoside ABC-type transport systems, permease components
LSFSVGAWALVIGMTIVLALLFSLMGKIWRIPVWPFALGIQLILQGMVFMMTDTMPVMMSTGQPSWIVRGFIGFIPVSFLLVVIIAVVVWGMFQVTPWGKPIKQQRQGDEVSFGWACGAQIACIVLGMVEAWLLMKRINVYQPSIFMGFSRPLMAFLMIFFSSCSKRLDNRVMPVIMMVLGAMFLNGFQVNMNLMMLSSFVQQGILLVLAIGSTWMNRVYRMKGWYPMVVLASIGSVMGWIAIPVVIVAMVYQKIKGYGWGDWMPLENTDILPNQVMSS